jgi:hypothetical protein
MSRYEESHVCGCKYKHPDLYSAMQQIKSLARSGKCKGVLAAYPCKYCQSVHIGRIINGIFKNELVEGEFDFVRWQ